MLVQMHTHTYLATFPSTVVALQLFSASFSAGPLAVQSLCSTVLHHHYHYCYNKKGCINLAALPADPFASVS